MSHELWSRLMSWHQRHQDVSVSWSGIRIQHQARVKPLTKIMTHFLFILLVAVLLHIWVNVWFYSFFCLSFILITSCARSAYTVSSLRLLLLWEDVCSCAKCVNAIRSYTLWSSWPFLWSGRFHLLWCERPKVYTVLDKPMRHLLSWVVQQTVWRALVADSDLQEVAGKNEQD